MIGLAFLFLATGAPAQDPVQLDPAKWRSGDLLFACGAADNENRSFRAVIVHYDQDGREVSFNHQGVKDAFSDVNLVAPIKTINFVQNPDRSSWSIKGEGRDGGRDYVFEIAISATAPAPMIADFTVTTAGKALRGEKCMRLPPRPVFTPHGENK